MKKWLQRLFTLLFLVAVASCSKSKPVEHEPIERVDENTLSLAPSVLHNMKFLKATLADFPEQLPLTGKISVTEDRTAMVPARVSGRIESISFASGESVKRGQILATLFSPDYIAGREELLQAVKAKQTAPKNGEFSDMADLVELSKKKLETMGLNRSDIETISALPSANSNLPVRSPRDGFLIAKSAVLGNLVNVGDTLFTIADIKKVWFSGDLYPEDVPKVRKDQEVVIRATHGGKPIFGKVSFISPVVDSTTRTIKIRALMDNSDSLLRADMYVQGNLILKRKQALLLPNEAIVRTASEHIVFKRADPPSIEAGIRNIPVKKVTVRLGIEQQGFTEIKEGLSEGDEVVTEGALLLYSALK